MKFIAIILVFICYGVSCKGKANNAATINDQMSTDTTGNAKFDSILNGLTKNYVLNFNDHSKKDLLEFYNKSSEQFYNDSITYHQSVNDFFSSDSTILNYLLKFKGDTSRCSWIYSHHPYSATLEKWEFTFNKEQGAAILIYDYIEYRDAENKAISSFPSEIKKIINKINLAELDSLISSNKEASITQLSEELKILLNR